MAVLYLLHTDICHHRPGVVHEDQQVAQHHRQKIREDIFKVTTEATMVTLDQVATVRVTVG